MMVSLSRTISLVDDKSNRSQKIPVAAPAAVPASELIPDDAGSGVHRKRVQSRTLTIWVGLASLGLGLFYQNVVELQPRTRAALLGLMFPGAGYIASANITGSVLCLLTYVLLPVALFAWFGAGGLLFPALVWILAIPGAYYASGETVFENAGLVAPVLLSAFFLYFNRLSARLRTKAKVRRDHRNELIPKALATMRESAVAPPTELDRELTLEELRDIQYVIDMGLKAIDNWDDFTVIDQFQTSALRYQLYEMIYLLATYQGVYVPNLHSYLNEAQLKTIEKSLTPKVMSFWKWESLWGKFTLNWDPVLEDNIMVSGWLLQAVMLYTANTGDLRYTKKGSLKFQVGKNNVYEHDLHSMDEALVRQWRDNPYCLFPCEPNWIYTPCNLYGITGQVVYDRVFGTDSAAKILPTFEQSLNANFTEPDGSILPIRSELTGFSIPGLCGALSDLVNAVLCRGHLDHVARRMWAIFREENVRFNEQGVLELHGLVGADKIDPGNYKGSEYAIWTMLAFVAGEYGDEKVRKAAKSYVLQGIGQRTTETGARALKKEGASTATNLMNVRGSLLRNEDWKRLISEGPSKTTLAGPILTSVPYPGVLVAKARSHSSKDLDMVLYPSAASGTFQIGVSRLAPNQMFSFGNGQRVKSDTHGKAKLDVKIDGRTAVRLVPVE